MNSGIYKITNQINGKVYVGKASNLNSRKINHFWALEHNNHHNPHLQRAYNKYGKDNFVFEIICLCLKEELSLKEYEWVKKLRVNKNHLGYNIEIIDPDCKKYHSEDTKKKISASKKGFKHSEETKQKMSSIKKGFCPPKLTMESARKANLGRKNSEDTKLRMSLAKKGKRIIKEKSKVDQYSLSMQYINSFESARDASEYLKIKNGDIAIRACCNGRLKTAYKYIWQFKNQK